MGGEGIVLSCRTSWGPECRPGVARVGGVCGNKSLSQPGCRTCWLVGLGRVLLPRTFNKAPALLNLCPEGLREKSFPSAQSSGVAEGRVSSSREERACVHGLTQSPACLHPAGSSPSFLCLLDWGGVWGRIHEEKC